MKITHNECESGSSCFSLLQFHMTVYTFKHSVSSLSIYAIKYLM
ncbi:hypothetical protein [Salmonella phage SD-1_S14]|nr:hypothetical protein [Salmonella phage SD-2_S15]WPK19262.1 hypothetical protein [Salmonella phage SD-6_S16]WPK19937.1 hypothetical protein [Salmonella phage SD-1_S14]WPK20955.1 hypothetical protein [Salmonella phage SD-15_S21]